MTSIHGAIQNPQSKPTIHEFGPEWTSMAVYKEVLRRMITCEIPQTNGMSHRSWAAHQYLIIRKPTTDVNLGVNFLKVGRWTKFLNDYFEVGAFTAFLSSLTTMNRSQVFTYPIPEKDRHSNGACLISVSYTPSPPIITLVSRATIWAPMGLLDLRFGSLLADQLGAELHWFTHQLQVSGMTSIPALINLGLWPTVKSAKTSVTARILYQYDRIKDKGEHSAFMTRRRYFKKINQAEALRKTKQKLPKFFPMIPDYFFPEDFLEFARETKEKNQ